MPEQDEKPFNAEAFEAQCAASTAARRKALSQKPGGDTNYQVAVARFMLGCNNPKHELVLSNIEPLVAAYDEMAAQLATLAQQHQEAEARATKLEAKVNEQDDALDYAAKRMVATEKYYKGELTVAAQQLAQVGVERDEWREGYRTQKAITEPMQARIAEWEEAFSKQYHELSAERQRTSAPIELLQAALPYIGDRPESPAEQYKAGGIRQIIQQYLDRQATNAAAPPLEREAAAWPSKLEWISVKDRLPEGRARVRTVEGYEAIAVCKETDQGSRYFVCVEWDNKHFSPHLVVGKVVEWCEEHATPTTTGQEKQPGGAPLEGSSPANQQEGGQGNG